MGNGLNEHPAIQELAAEIARCLDPHWERLVDIQAIDEFEQLTVRIARRVLDSGIEIAHITFPDPMLDALEEQCRIETRLRKEAQHEVRSWKKVVDRAVDHPWRWALRCTWEKVARR